MSTNGNIFDELTQGGGEERPGDERPGDEPATPSSPEHTASYTSRDVKAAVQELLKYGLLEADRKSHLYRTATTNQTKINEILEPLDLSLRVDDVRGLAFLVVQRDAFEPGPGETEADDWSHPLVRRQRLTLEQSLLVAILRQLYLVHEQEAGTGAGNLLVPVDELVSSLELYLGSSGSDAKDQKRVCNLLENVRAHGVVSEIDDKDQVAIRPIITHLASPESLTALLGHLSAVAGTRSRS